MTGPRFPAHTQIGGDAKIPSLLYYDKTGNVKAAGAEALTESVLEDALDNDWTKAEWSVIKDVKVFVELLFTHEIQVETSSLPEASGLLY